MTKKISFKFGKSTAEDKKYVINLLLVSFLALYLELIFIRWLASEIRVFAYFKNFPLMAAFLGLGVGCAVANRRRILTMLTPLLLSIICVIASFSPQLKLVHLFFPDPSLYQWTGSIISPNLMSFLETVSFVKPFIGVIPNNLLIFFIAMAFFLIVFVLFGCSVTIFYPIGQKLGEAMAYLPPLTAYTINIVGSLAGTLMFTFVSFMKLPPWIWLAIALPIIVYISSQKIWAVALGIFTIAVNFFAYSTNQQVMWSPYYRISYAEGSAGSYTVSVDHDYHQKILNLSSESVRQHEALLEPSQQYYDLPYQLTSKLQGVLIIGSGTGNDVAAALRAEVNAIDAVEIDPALVQLGKRFHSEKPYQSSHVNININDARAYFHKKQGKTQYDLIVYGLVDSHTALSSISSLRLEFHLYTKESIQETLSLLNPQKGVVFINFSVGWKEWLGQRLYNTILAAAGQKPLVLESTQYDSSITYVFGPGLEDVKQRLAHMLTGRADIKIMDKKYGGSDIGICTDDWPFLYMNPHSFPIAYAIALGILLFGGWFLLRISLRPIRKPTVEEFGINWHMFLMGAAFLLVETKNIIQLSLLFGATWIVNSVVFISIFVMILLANIIVSRTKWRNVNVLFILLAASLFISYVMPFSSLTLLPFLSRAFIGGIITALPVFFSALIFATTFRLTPNSGVALGSNILGALFGGVLEALSLAIGIKSLSLLAIVIYVGAWYAFIVSLRSRQATELTEAVG